MSALLGFCLYSPHVGVESKIGVQLEGVSGEARPLASLPKADNAYL